MRPAGTLYVLFFVVLLAVSQYQITSAAREFDEERNGPGARTLAFIHSQQALTGRSSRSDYSYDRVGHMGRRLSQARKPVAAPSSTDLGPASPNSVTSTVTQRIYLSDNIIKKLERQQRQKQLSGADPEDHLVYRRRRRRRDGSLAARAVTAAAGITPAAIVTPTNICLNKNGDPNYNMLGYNGRNFSEISTYPYNTVVRLEIVEFNKDTGAEGKRYLCTATALSDVILVTSSHCVKPGTDSNFPDVYTIAHYGYDGKRATAGTRVSRCIAWYDDLTQVDNAIIVLRQPMRLPKYMQYGYVNATTPRRNAVTWMLSYPADAAEMACLSNLGIDSPYYYGMVETRGVNQLLNYRVGRRCEAGDRYAIWAMGSMIGGQSGGCLVHDRTDTCLGTAAYSCEADGQCSSECPNAWGGFNAEFPLSGLWQACGIADDPGKKDNSN